MSLLQEFKEFAMRGNVVDLAVGIIIGGAFGKIVSSFVSDILMPPLGVVLGGIDFSNLSVTIREAQDKMPPVLLKYGLFVNAVVDFVIVAFAIFLLIKAINTARHREPPSPEAPTRQEQLLEEIRDLLKNQSS
jgi:large conductance mechanosensitive channel